MGGYICGLHGQDDRCSKGNLVLPVQNGEDEFPESKNQALSEPRDEPGEEEPQERSKEEISASCQGEGREYAYAVSVLCK